MSNSRGASNLLGPRPAQMYDFYRTSSLHHISGESSRPTYWQVGGCLPRKLPCLGKPEPVEAVNWEMKPNNCNNIMNIAVVRFWGWQGFSVG